MIPSNPTQSTAPNEYQREYQKLRTKRVSEILKSQQMSQDDFVFLDNFIKTYFENASKALKNVLTQDALKKIYQGTQYQELDAGHVVFTPEEFTKYYILIVSGRIDVIEDKAGEDSVPSVTKIFGKGDVLNPGEMTILSQPNNKSLRGVCAEKTEVLIYEKDHYESVIKEFASASTNSKLKAVAKNFLKIKKMDRSSKEEFMTYFKSEKFTKGTVIVNIKSRVEEIYVIQTGKVAICTTADAISSYPHSKLIIGVLGPEQVFNEWNLLFEKPSPYYAVCLEDTEILSLAKTNLNFVTDPDTLNDLRANCQCKHRLQCTVVEKYTKQAPAEIEKSQNKICDRAGIKLKDILDIFEKFDPKSKNSLQYMKNLEKFNQGVTKSGIGMQKFTGAAPAPSTGIEYATPRLVSKDAAFRTLDPQRQRALFNLRNEALNRRQGNTAPSTNTSTLNKVDLVKMQGRLLEEEKREVEKIVQRKSISDKLGINKPAEEKQATGDGGEDKQNMFKKLNTDNSSLLAKFNLGVAPAKKEEPKKEPKEEEKKEPVQVKEVVSNPETTEEKKEVAESTSTTTPTEAPKVKKPAHSLLESLSDVKPSDPPVINPKMVADADDPSSLIRRNLANLLLVNSGPNTRPQNDVISRRRAALLNNPNLL